MIFYIIQSSHIRQFSLPDEALGSAPGSFDHGFVIHPREKVLLQMVKGTVRDRLVDAEFVECFLGLASVFELCEHDFAVLG